MKESGRAAVAARDPKPGATNRPGFDLGGAVSDAKPEHRTKREPERSQDIVKPGQMTGDAQPEAERKPHKASKKRSAVAGVRNWLRGK